MKKCAAKTLMLVILCTMAFVLDSMSINPPGEIKVQKI